MYTSTANQLARHILDDSRYLRDWPGVVTDLYTLRDGLAESGTNPELRQAICNRLASGLTYHGSNYNSHVLPVLAQVLQTDVLTVEILYSIRAESIEG